VIGNRKDVVSPGGEVSEMAHVRLPPGIGPAPYQQVQTQQVEAPATTPPAKTPK
jgi:hypothetical protein